MKIVRVSSGKYRKCRRIEFELGENENGIEKLENKD